MATISDPYTDSTTFPGHRVIAILREKSGATIYRAIRDVDGRAVTIKVAKGLDPASGEARLRDELEIIERLAGTDNARDAVFLDTVEGPCLVLGHIEGRPLGQLVAERPPLDVVMTIGAAIAARLRGLHELGIVHRDIKPDNVLVGDAPGDVQIIDFGLATSEAHVSRRAGKRTATVAGTPAYMAPEQGGRMNRVVDGRSDLYALGVTLYELLTGELPFGTAPGASPLEVLHAHMATAPRPPHAASPRVPGPLSAIILKLLAKLPEDRYQTADGLVHDLTLCLGQWRATGTLRTFPLGARDISTHFRLPERLYGRLGEIDAAERFLDRAWASGQPGLLVIAGEPGIGKSALVREVQRGVVRRHGYSISGKFDQYRRGLPFHTIIEAFRTLMKRLLSEDEARLGRVRERLARALGDNGGVIAEVLPEVAWVMGEQAPPARLGPTETQNRFKYVFQQFLAAFATAEHPLSLFLDDMQWADAATLGLLDAILTSPERFHLGLILTYRSSEVAADHALMSVLRHAQEAGVNRLDVTLGPLERPALESLIGDVTHHPAERTRDLAELVLEKTAGNPFFVGAFLKTLYEERLISFDAATCEWRWDIKRLAAQAITDNVVELMRNRLTRLAPDARALVTTAAALGSAFAVTDLAAVAERSEDDIASALAPAVTEGLLVLGDDSTDTTYAFCHDRIQQAAYSLLAEDERPRVHLHIGRALLALHAEPRAREDRLFDIVDQLNQGAVLVTDSGERQTLLGLNLDAGRKAKEATAYAAARACFERALDLLPEASWATDYERNLAAVSEAAETEYLCGNFARSEALFARGLGRARTRVDAARVHCLQLRLYQVAGRYADAVALGLDALARLGLRLPDGDEDLARLMAAERATIEAHPVSRDVRRIVDLPLIEDPTARATIDVLSAMAPCAYIGRPPLFPVVTLLMVRLSLEHGTTEESCFAYSCYAVMLIAVYGEIEKGYRLSEASIALNAKLGDRKMRGPVLHVHGDHIAFWRDPIAGDLPLLEQAFAACVETGNWVYGNYVAFQVLWHAVMSGGSLERIQIFSEKFAQFSRRTGHQTALLTIRVQQQLASCLMGKTTAPQKLDDGDGSFDEADVLARLQEANFGCGVAFYRIIKLTLHTLYGDHDAALAQAAAVEPILGAVMAMPMEVTYHFFLGLALAGKATRSVGDERASLLARLSAQEARFSRWTDACPANFEHRLAFLLGERLRLEGDSASAFASYARGITAARAQGFLHGEAIGNELAAQLALAEGHAARAQVLLAEAKRCYGMWGARAKVADIERQEIALAARTSSRPSLSHQTVVTERSQLDLEVILRVSQILSGERNLGRLLESLLRGLTVYAGAERACLALAGDDGWSLARDTSRSDDAEADDGRPLSACGDILPLSAINYVARTGGRLTHDRAHPERAVATDPYLIAQRPKTWTCWPLLRDGRPVAVVYLESRLVDEAFADEAFVILEHLGGQIAAAIENAALFTALADENARRRQVEDSLRASEERFRATVDNAGVGIGHVAPDGRFMLVNRQLCAILGYEADEVLMHTADSLGLAEDQAQLSTCIRAALAGDSGNFALETRFVTRGGAVIWTHFTGAAVRSVVGEPQYLIAVIEDVTQRKRAEEEQQRLRAREQAALAASKLKSEFLANMSHEIRTPIGGVLGMTSLILDAPLSAEVREYAESARTAAQSLLGIINDVLDFSKVEAGKLDIAQVALDPARVVNEACRPLVMAAAAKGVTLAIIVDPPNPGRMLGDPGRIGQIVTNLVNNAIKFTPRGRITVRLRVAGDTGARWLRCEIEDSGIGIDAEAMARLFQPFTQGDASTSRRFGGTGLGLSICKRLIELMGGAIGVSSTSGEGSTFWFTLPAVAPEGDAPGEAAAPPLRGLRLPPGIRVLVAEDELINRKVVVKQLEKLGCDVHAVGNGREALARLATLPCDLVLMDCQMPEMDGYEASRLIRASASAFRDVPVIALTASAIKGDREKCLEAGMNDYLSKPIEPEALAAVIARWLPSGA